MESNMYYNENNEVVSLGGCNELHLYYGNKDGQIYGVIDGKSVKNDNGKGPTKESQEYVGTSIDKDYLLFFNKKYGLFYLDKNFDKHILDISSYGMVIHNAEQALCLWNTHKEQIIRQIEYPNTGILSDEEIVKQIALYKGTPLMTNDFISTVSFGSTFFINNLMEETGYNTSVLSFFPAYSNVPDDVVKALIMYKLEYGGSYNKVDIWYRQDMVQLLFPNINLSSQNISNYLVKIGNDSVRLNILKRHIDFMMGIYDILKLRIYIDSTPFDNNCAIYISRYYVHGTDKHHGFRVYVLIHIPTGLPLYFDIIPGNIIDQTLLDKVILHFNNLGYKIQHICGDSGFGNIHKIERVILLDNLPSISTRLSANCKLYNELLEKEAEKLLTNNCDSFDYGDRRIRAVRTETVLTDPNNEENKQKIFCYVYLDEATRANEMSKLWRSEEHKGMPKEIYDEKTKFFGIFVLISVRCLTTKQALVEYYDRIYAESFLDLIKNELDALPIGLHSMPAIYGHLLLCFIASFFYMIIQRKLQLSDSEYINIHPTYNDDNILEADPANFETDIIRQEVSKKLAKTPVSNLMFELNGQNAVIFHNNLHLNKDIPIKLICPDKPQAQANDYYKAFGLASPKEITYTNRIVSVDYGDNIPKQNIKHRIFADHLCSTDLKKISEGARIGKPNVSSKDFILDDFFKIFDARVKGQCSGRPPGSKNKSTLDKEAEENARAFNVFDNFFDPWWENQQVKPRRSTSEKTQNDVSDPNQSQKDFYVEDGYIFDKFFAPWWENTDAANPKEDQNAPEENKSSDACNGSKTKITIAREGLLKELTGIGPDLPKYSWWIKKLRDAEKKIKEEGIQDPYSSEGIVRLKAFINDTVAQIANGEIGPGRPPGKSALTLKRESLLQEALGIGPDSPKYAWGIRKLRDGEKKITAEDIDPYSPEGIVRLKSFIQTENNVLSMKRGKKGAAKPPGANGKSIQEPCSPEGIVPLKSFVQPEKDPMSIKPQQQTLSKPPDAKANTDFSLLDFMEASP